MVADAHIADMRAIADLRNSNLTSTVLATRGERLRPERVRFSDHDQMPEAFRTEVLSVSEINADERFVGVRHRSTPTISTPPSRNSTPGTSPAKRPPTRALVGHRMATLRSTGTNFLATTPDWVIIDHRLLVTIDAE